MQGNAAGSVLSNCHKTTLADGEAVILAKAASILKRHIFQYSQGSFIVEFSEDSLIKSVPSLLFAFIKMTLLGPNIEYQIPVVGQRDKVACALSYLIMFNARKKFHNPLGDEMHHFRERETPTPLYVGLKLQSHDQQAYFCLSQFIDGIVYNHNGKN